MSDNKKHLLLLYDRPQEPVFMPKGEKRTIFDIPDDYLSDHYHHRAMVINNRFGDDVEERVPVKKISLPPLGEILDLKRDTNFSLFIPQHRRIAGKLIDLFTDMAKFDDFLSFAVYARDRVNPYLFNYALSVAILHRPDTQDIDLPTFMESFPDKFVDSKVFSKAKEEAGVVPEGARRPIEIPKDFTASDLEEEHRVAYFREDLGINLHHWHWHLVYPHGPSKRIASKNRRGELFYYMHQQIIARYNTERLCNGLKRVKRFNDFKSPIKEAYFPKLDIVVASRPYPARVAHQKLSDLNRTEEKIKRDVDDLKRYSDRIYAAIHQGIITDDKGNTISLTETEGIDILGNIIESSVLSPNQKFYGSLHNMGHVFFAAIHDPDSRHREQLGVMGDSATAMRDPIFYRWHAYIDDIFHEHKATLPRYSESRLNYPGITVSKIEIQSHGNPVNTLNTFWQQSDVDLSKGMDFHAKGPLFVRFTHLQHQPFTYHITVNNKADGPRMGTCRIFLAPKFDESGNPWLFNDQRLMFIELDKFVVQLKQGPNTITRASIHSSVTIPFERTFRNLNLDQPLGREKIAETNFCGCGWPQHMLIPKGTAEGLKCELFVMISNYKDDKIDQDTSGVCNDAGSYCGIRDKLYPDRRSMGYPFDRMPRRGVVTLQQFLTTNMGVQDVSVIFTNKTIKPKEKK